MELKAEIGALKTQAAQLAQTIAFQQKIIADKDERIEDLTFRIGKLTAYINDKGSVMDGLRRPPRIADIIQCTCTYFGLSEAEVRANRRGQWTHARHVAFYLARRLTLQSYPAIGRAFGDRDHTTVMHGCNKIETMLATDENAVETTGRTPLMAYKSIQFIKSIKSAKKAVEAITALLLTLETERQNTDARVLGAAVVQQVAQQ